MTRAELFRLALAAAPGVLALLWNIFKHFADRAEKRREHQRQREAELTFISASVEAKPGAGSRARVRVSNQGTRAVILDAATFWYGQERFKNPKTDGANQTFGQYAGIPLSSEQSDSEPLQPGHHRDYWLRIGPATVDAVEAELRERRVWLTVSTTSGTELRIGHDRIGWVIERLIGDQRLPPQVQPLPDGSAG